MRPRTALLQVLVDGRGYGMELAARVEERTQGSMKIRQGALYPALWRLEEDGCVTSWESEPRPERGGRPRIYYEITEDGLREARENETAVLGLLGRLSPV